jgi:DNA repair protein SbcD/Mre11
VRLLHTSDWHLGRSLHGFSLRAEQEAGVQAIVDLAAANAVDVVVVAGDVFDRAVPPVESLRTLNSALAQLDALGITTILTAGNHDSGDRLATYAGLLRDRVRLVGSLSDVGSAIEFTDEHGPVLVYPLPYLEPDVARSTLSGADEPLARSHEAVMRAALDRVEADIIARGGPRAIAIGHAFVADVGVPIDDVTSDSERDLTIGGVQIVPAAAFADRGLCYVALGHLHRPQSVGGSDPAIAYSGSLLRYSLSESGHAKSVVLVDVGAPGAPPTLRRVDLPKSRGMARLAGTMDELLGSAYEDRREDFVELVVVDSAYPERMHARLDAAFPFAVRKEHRPSGVVPGGDAVRGDARGRDPVEVTSAFVQKVTGRVATSSEIALLRSVYESVRPG